MTPVERAARALCRLDGHLENIRLGGEPMWVSYKAQVHAVLSAVREPDEAMLAAGNAKMGGKAADVWAAMIEVVSEEH
jgi:hypothetical protein